MGTWMSGSRNHNEFDEQLAWRQHELLRLATTICVSDDRQTTIARFTSALPAITGFEAVTLFVAQAESDALTLAGTVGLTSEDSARIMAAPYTRQQAMALLSPERALHPGRSYRIRPQHAQLVTTISRTRATTSVNNRAETWTALDTLLIPLHNKNKDLIGLLVLDTPGNPRNLQNGAAQPMLDLIEACGDMLAMALENLRIYQALARTQRQTERGLEAMQEQFAQVQQGNFTIAAAEPSATLADIADHFHDMLRYLSTTLAGMRHASQVINECAKAVGNMANDAMHVAQSQAQQIEAASAMITSVATSIEDMAQVSETAWTVAGNAREFSQAGRISVEEAVAGMDGVRQVALQSSQRVKRLAESLQEIETIVQQVSDFSARTNLLAINSSIEATRAGDFGRGFTIIAHEIRTLALNSADAARQIATRIKTIQIEAAAVVTAIAEGTERVVVQSDRIVDAGAALLVIDEVTEQIATLNESIRTIAQEEATQTTTLTASMQDMLLLTETTRTSVQQIATSMTEVVGFAAALDERIGQLRLSDELGR